MYIHNDIHQAAGNPSTKEKLFTRELTALYTNSTMVEGIYIHSGYLSY